LAILRSNGKLRTEIGVVGADFVEFACEAIQRILPHVEAKDWSENVGDGKAGAFWVDNQRKKIRFTIRFELAKPKALNCEVTRRAAANALSTLDTREHDICYRIALRVSAIIRSGAEDGNANTPSIKAIKHSFDETVIADHLQEHHGLSVPINAVFEMLHTLSEQTYENKALVFGCIIDPTKTVVPKAPFPEDFMKSKKYKALSDGLKTAYVLSAKGKVIDFSDIEKLSPGPQKGMRYFPEWAEHLASASTHKRCGIALTRQGDILVFDSGSLRFTYRYGQWQYWNHAHVVSLLTQKARAQKVLPKIVGNVVGSIYRTALDISFRRSGGLFVLLRNKANLRKIVRDGDAIGDRREKTDQEFDELVSRHKVQSLSRSVAVDLASLDGAVVLANSGKILAYGAVLQPQTKGKLRGTEGSRTKAAIGASNYGLAIKVSSDGDISIYRDGREYYPHPN
jgi:hypothetical protein